MQVLVCCCFEGQITVALGDAAIRTTSQFYVVRVLLGLAEGAPVSQSQLPCAMAHRLLLLLAEGHCPVA